MLMSGLMLLTFRWWCLDNVDNIMLMFVSVCGWCLVCEAIKLTWHEWRPIGMWRCFLPTSSPAPNVPKLLWNISVSELPPASWPFCGSVCLRWPKNHDRHQDWYPVDQSTQLWTWRLFEPLCALPTTEFWVWSRRRARVASRRDYETLQERDEEIPTET